MAAVQAAWGIEIKERQDAAIRAKRAGLPYDSTVFNELEISETLTPSLDTVSNQYYINTPIIQSTGGNVNWSVAPVEGFNEIFKINKRSDLNGMDTHEMIFAYYQRSSTTQRIYFINLPDSCGVLFTASQNLSNLGDDDIMPIPSDKETWVVQSCVEFFTGQKMTPADIVVDQTDIKNDTK
jgi:hypothetical protein